MNGCWHRLVPALKSHHKGSNATSIRSPVVDEERMRSGHWLGSVICVPFSALTLMVGWQEGHLAIKIPHCTNPKRLSSGTDGGEPEGNQLILVHVEKRPLNESGDAGRGGCGHRGGGGGGGRGRSGGCRGGCGHRGRGGGGGGAL